MWKLSWKTVFIVSFFVIYSLFSTQKDLSFSVKEWERLVNVILKCGVASNLLVYDINEDGWVDVRDLCILYSKLSNKHNKSTTKEGGRFVDLISIRNCYSKTIVSLQVLESKLSRQVLDDGLGICIVFQGSNIKYRGRGSFIRVCGYKERNIVSVLRC